MINNVVLLFSTTSEEIHCEQLLRYWYLSPKRTLYSLLLGGGGGGGGAHPLHPPPRSAPDQWGDTLRAAATVLVSFTQKDLILLVPRPTSPSPPPNPHRPAIFAYVIVGDSEIKVSPYFEGLSQAHYAMVICFQYAFFSSRRKHPLPVLVRVSERLSQC